MARDTVLDRSIGAVLKRHRLGGGLQARMTQAQVAAAIGLAGPGGPVSISRFESGAVHVSEERLAALAGVLGTTAADIKAEAVTLAGQDHESMGDTASRATEALSQSFRAGLGGGSAEENHLRRVAIDEEVADRRERTEALLERLHDAQQELVDGVLKPYFQFASRVDIPLPKRPSDVESRPLATPDSEFEAAKDALRWQIVTTLGKSSGDAKTAAAGATAGTAAAAAAVFAWAAASTSASTRVAALGSAEGAGAGATTLAWLGGGPLAAGGIGLAGGSLLMGSIVMLPALIAAGGIMAVQGHRLRRRAAEDSERLQLAEQELEDTRGLLQTTWDILIKTRTVIDALTTVGLREVRWLGRETAAEQPSRGATVTPDRRRLDGLTELVVVATTVLGLPVLRDLQPDALDDAERDERTRWIHFVLDKAAAEVEAHQQLAGTRGY